MIPVRRSQAEHPNPHLLELRRASQDETAREWIERAARRMKQKSLYGSLLLVGGTSLTDFRVRMAQSHARQDMSPSLWSHVAILGERRTGKSGRPDHELYEIALAPAQGFGAVPATNGVQLGRLSHYDAAARYPNLAVLSFARTLSRDGLSKAMLGFSRERRLIDAPALILEWLGYVWGVGGDRGNPLVREAGLPSAAFVESAYATLGIDLTPGASTRSSSPEIIWQAAKWWHDFYGSEVSGGRPPRGCYCIDQPAASCTVPEEPVL